MEEKKCLLLMKCITFSVRPEEMIQPDKGKKGDDPPKTCLFSVVLFKNCMLLERLVCIIRSPCFSFVTIVFVQLP